MRTWHWPLAALANQPTPGHSVPSGKEASVAKTTMIIGILATADWSDAEIRAGTSTEARSHGDWHDHQPPSTSWALRTPKCQ